MGTVAPLHERNMWDTLVLPGFDISAKRCTMDDERTSSGSGRHPSRRRRKPAATRQQDVKRSEAAAPRGPSRERPARRRIHWARHAVEFFVIVAGIMVSFLLNEWRQEVKDRRTEQALLRDLLTDLRQDSLTLTKEIEEIEQVTRYAQRLIDHAEVVIPRDSIGRMLALSLSYSRMPLQRVTYQAMRSTGHTSLMRDRELLYDVLKLYEQDYFMIDEICDIDKRFVVDRMFPFVDTRVDIMDPDLDALKAMFSTVQWRNLIQSSRYFKQYLIQMMRSERDTVDGLMRRIEEQLTP